MQNFDYQTPTRLIFGKGVVAQLPEVMAQFGKKILLTYGGGSIKKIGLYDSYGACKMSCPLLLRNILKHLEDLPELLLICGILAAESR